MGTRNGALALGLGHDTGMLDVGKSADLTFVDLAVGNPADPYDLLFRPGNRIARAMCGRAMDQPGTARLNIRAVLLRWLSATTSATIE